MTRAPKAPLLLLAAALAVLGAAYGFQYLGGLEPCILCYYQRYPWMAAIALFALAAGRGAARARALALGGAVLLAGALLALYHVGVEEGVFAGPSVCDPGLGAVSSIEELRQALSGRTVVRCDRPAWVFLGLSMAAWNAALSGLVGLGALAAVGRRSRSGRQNH